MISSVNKITAPHLSHLSVELLKVYSRTDSMPGTDA